MNNKQIVKQLLKDTNWTQQMLADKLGTTKVAVHNKLSENMGRDNGM